MSVQVIPSSLTQLPKDNVINLYKIPIKQKHSDFSECFQFLFKLTVTLQFKFDLFLQFQLGIFYMFWNGRTVSFGARGGLKQSSYVFVSNVLIGVVRIEFEDCTLSERTFSQHV